MLDLANQRQCHKSMPNHDANHMLDQRVNIGPDQVRQTICNTSYISQSMKRSILLQTQKICPLTAITCEGVSATHLWSKNRLYGLLHSISLVAVSLESQLTLEDLFTHYIMKQRQALTATCQLQNRWHAL